MLMVERAVVALKVTSTQSAGALWSL